METIETTVSYITLIEGDILRIQFKPDCYVDVKEYEENLAAYKKLMPAEKVYLLTIAPPGANLSPEVRDKFSTAERSAFKIAEAFVIKSLPHKIIANFITKVQRPKHLLKFFDSEKKALAWLHALKKKAGKGQGHT
jgi:hypothetical protein